MSSTTLAENATDASKPSESVSPGKLDATENDNNNEGPKVRKRRLDVNPNLIISDGRSKRRKTPTPDPTGKEEIEEKNEDGLYDPKDPQRAKMLGMKLYTKLVNAKSSDGELLSEPFVQLPSKKAFPDYYEMIKVPMSLEMVKQKLDKMEYENLKGVVTDLGQIFNNAKRYNVKESVIFQFAKKLHKTVRTFYEDASHPSQAPPPPAPPAPVPEPEPEVEESDDEESKPDTSGAMDVDPSGHMSAGPSRGSADLDGAASQRGKKRGSYMKDGPTVYKLVKPILKTIKEARANDGSGREIAGIFMDLPDRKAFADYYETIQNPISLRAIEDRMMARMYQHYQEFYDDIGLMCRNAQTYNEDESEVYKDAQQIMQILEQNRSIIEDRINRPAIDRSRPRPSTSTPGRIGDSSSYAQRPQYPQSPSPAFYPSHSPQPIGAPGPSTQGNFLPALPKGVVTEEIVASLDRYPAYEQSAWASTLPPPAVQMYRQLVAANEAKKNRSLQSQNHPQLADLPSTARLNGTSTLPDRLAPPLPTIKYLDFAFSTAGTADRSSTIRLHNMRGVVTHAVVLGSDTSELELTAYIADPPKQPETPSTTGTPSAAVEALETVPEVSLRVNGNQGSLPKFIQQTTTAGDSARPAGMRWTIHVPPSRAETKIEVVATKPGALAETSAIFVSRQY